MSPRYFPHLPIVYTLLYAALPRAVSLPLMTLWTFAFAFLEFARIRRPEVNARFLRQWEGFYVPAELRAPSRFFWAALGCWLTMVIFNGSKIVLMALGLLAFGKEAAQWGGKKWGKTRWPKYPQKTVEGSACFVIVSMAWALISVRLRWPVAFLGSAAGAWIEVERWQWPNAVVLPLLGGLVLSVLNLFLGRR
jgi:dolichol kinase